MITELVTHMQITFYFPPIPNSTNSWNWYTEFTRITLVSCPVFHYFWRFDGLAQDYSNSSALAVELLQSCAKPSTYWLIIPWRRHITLYAFS